MQWPIQAGDTVALFVDGKRVVVSPWLLLQAERNGKVLAAAAFRFLEGKATEDELRNAAWPLRGLDA